MELNSPFYASLSEGRKAVYLRQYKLQAVAFTVILVSIALGFLFGLQTGLITGFAILSILALGIYALLRKQTSGQLFMRQRRSNRDKSTAHLEELESFAKQLQKERDDA